MMTDSTESLGRRRRRRRLRASLAIGVALAVLAAGAAAVGFGGGEPDRPEPTSAAFSLVQITQETLVEYVTVDGEVGYGPATPLGAKATGTVTWLPKPATVIKRGQTLLRVDDTPIVLLYGALPTYRPLAEPLTGPDVEQFEVNLRALGYTGFTVDKTFSASTTAAVKRWQHDLGLPETGTVDADRVSYTPGPLRIASQLARVGTASPADMLTYTATAKLVTATVETAQSGWAAPGVTVTITPPGSTAVAGTIQAVGEPIAVEGQEGAAPQGVGLIITVANQKAIAGVERGPVEVRYAAKERKDVLTVPVGALLALAEGGFGLEIVADGAARVVAVQTGMFAGGRVEVSGPDLRAGLTVRMPK